MNLVIQKEHCSTDLKGPQETETTVYPVPLVFILMKESHTMCMECSMFLYSAIQLDLSVCV